MKPIETKKEELEQEDYFDDEYIETVSEKYGLLIGKFIISFNELEHELNQAISKYFIDDSDSKGYRVIKFLTNSSKVNLFYELYLERATFVNTHNKSKIKLIKNKLDEIREFRNKLVHANWSTLTKEGYVRTKVESDKEEGVIKFVNAKILPKTIKSYINQIDFTIIKIWEYLEKEQ